MKGETKGLSLFSQLLIALLGVVIVMSALLTTVFTVFSRKSVQKQTEEYVRQQFQTIGLHFRSELRNAMVKDLQLLASNPLLDDFIMSSDVEREVNARSVERLFLESLKTGRSYESIAFVDASGTELVKADWSGRQRRRGTVGGQPFFRRLRTEQPGSIEIEGPFTDKYGNIVFTGAIYKIDADIGKFGGAVVIDYSLAEFFNYLDRIRFFDENPLWLLAPDGAVLKQPVNRKTSFDPRAQFNAGLQTEPRLVAVPEGMLMYQDLSLVPDRPLLRLAVAIPSSLLFRDMQPVFRFVFMVFLVSLVLTSVIAYLLARYLSGPIIDLAHAASRLAKGGSARVRVKATGEVQTLVESFNRMAGDLEKTTVSRDYVDNIIRNMMDTLIVVSREGLIVQVNAAACALLGYTEKELVGLHASAVIGEEPESGLDIFNLFTSQTIVTRETTYRTKDGGSLAVLFSASVMYDKDANVQGIVCVAQDITERKRAEARLQSYSQELAEINEELRSFAYIVSHDLRAPLVNIKGFSDELIYGLKEIKPVLDRQLDGFDGEQRRRLGAVLDKDIPEALTFIGSSVNRMDNLITSILKLSRAGRRKLVPEPIQSGDFVRMILNTLAHQIESHKISVTVGELPDLLADRTALEQIFGNLLDNAVKYLDPARPGAITISAEQCDHEAIFHVRDNGRGMAKEDIPRAFEIFRRVGPQDVPGEGMGLAYVKTLVRLLGGRIWCESEPGVGTTFSFSLPNAAGHPGGQDSPGAQA